MKVELRKHFSCAHFYKQDQWTTEKNQAEFGKCFTEYGHGHDYRLEIRIEVPTLKSVSDLEKKFPDLDAALSEVTERLDHQHLNFVIPEFKSQIPTTENLALFLHQEIQKSLLKIVASARILHLKLSETPDIWVEL